jgi:hypothetical protein
MLRRPRRALRRAPDNEKRADYLNLVVINGLVASIFFDFFKVFLAILDPPRLICPVGHRSVYMQSDRQTSLSFG